MNKTTTATIRSTNKITTTIVITNIEEKDDVIKKIVVEIKRFIKEYVVLSLYYATF